MRTLFALAFGALLFAGSASAQSAFVPYIGYNLEDEDFLVGVGFRLGLPVAAPVALSIQPSVEYQFADVEDVTVAQANIDALAHFAAGAITPYVGAGAGILFVSVADESETEVGLNVLGGVEFMDTAVGKPFVQGRYSTRGEASDAFSILGGTVFVF